MMSFPGHPGWNERIHGLTKTMIAVRRDYPWLRYGNAAFLEPEGASRADDLFLVRSPRTGHHSEAGVRILYAYSTHGGVFPLHLSAFPSKKVWDVEFRTELAPGASNSVKITLDPGSSRVILFDAHRRGLWSPSPGSPIN